MWNKAQTLFKGDRRHYIYKDKLYILPRNGLADTDLDILFTFLHCHSDIEKLNHAVLCVSEKVQEINKNLLNFVNFDFSLRQNHVALDNSKYDVLTNQINIIKSVSFLLEHLSLINTYSSNKNYNLLDKPEKTEIRSLKMPNSFFMHFKWYQTFVCRRNRYTHVFSNEALTLIAAIRDYHNICNDLKEAVNKQSKSLSNILQLSDVENNYMINKLQKTVQLLEEIEHDINYKNSPINEKRSLGMVRGQVKFALLA